MERLGPVKGWSFVADADSYQVLHLMALLHGCFTMLMTMLGLLVRCLTTLPLMYCRNGISLKTLSQMHHQHADRWLL